MSKQITVLMPCVPQEFILTLTRVRPPYLEDYTFSHVAPGISDLELTFAIPAKYVDESKDFEREVRCTMLMALIIFYESFPTLIPRLMAYLLHADEKWKERQKQALKTHPSKVQDRLIQWFIHDLVVQGGDLIGIDHRPCFDSGRCLHEEK